MKIIKALILSGVLAYTGMIGGTAVHAGRLTVTETRELAPFEELILSVQADVSITKGEAYTCTITADHELVPLIVTEHKGTALQISVRNSFTFVGKITLSITMPLLTRLEIQGAGVVTLDNVSKDSLNLLINGSGVITAIGQVTVLKGAINGSGMIRAGTLEAEEAEGVVNGSGEIHLNVLKQLAAEVNGSGNIFYMGAPVITRSVVHGSGRIRALSQADSKASDR